MASKLCAYTRFNLPPTLSCYNGDVERVNFIESLGSDGVKYVVPNGSTPIQEQIDAFKDDCDIYKILDRLSLSGASADVVAEALSQFRPDMFDPGKYGDFTNLPKNIHDVSKFYKDSVAFFASLPVDIRQKYHYSVDEFFADFDNFVKEYSAAPSAAPSVAPSATEPVKEVDSNE